MIGIVMPTMSTSWNASVPIEVENTWPVMAMHRHRVHVGVGDGGDEVGGAGAGGRDRDAELAGCRGVALGRVAGALLVPHEDVADRRRGHELVVERQDGAAGDAEDVGDAEHLERAEDRRRTRSGSAGAALPSAAGGVATGS